MMEIDTQGNNNSSNNNLDGRTDTASGPSSSSRGQEKTVKVHPLAIIGISDHHTRVIRGGSRLKRNAPVLGLLFGYQDGLDISIVDAEEVEYSHHEETTIEDEKEVEADKKKSTSTDVFFGGGTEEEQKSHKNSILTKIELHKEVFSKHEVIGWYRVGSQITNEDLYINNGPMKEYNESPLFVLMNPDVLVEKEQQQEEQQQEELPISVYEALVTSGRRGGGGNSVFVGLDFELNTCEPERIAVEKVVKTQVTEGTSGLDIQLQSLTSSIRSMNSRITIILEYLYQIQEQQQQQSNASSSSAALTSSDYKLLRQIDCLLRQLPVVVSEFSSPFNNTNNGNNNNNIHNNHSFTLEYTNEYNDSMILSYLASIAKTLKALQCYSDKFRLIYESGGGAGGGGVGVGGPGGGGGVVHGSGTPTSIAAAAASSSAASGGREMRRGY